MPKLRKTDQKSYRSADTGLFVKEAFALKNPTTTYLDDMTNVLNSILNKLDHEIAKHPVGSPERKVLKDFGTFLEGNVKK